MQHTLGKIATRLGFERTSQLSSALTEFLQFRNLNREIFVTSNDSDLSNLAEDFVRRHGCNYWTSNARSLSFPKDRIFIELLIYRALILKKKNFIASGRAARNRTVLSNSTSPEITDADRFSLRGESLQHIIKRENRDGISNLTSEPESVSFDALPHEQFSLQTSTAGPERPQSPSLRATVAPRRIVILRTGTPSRLEMNSGSPLGGSSNPRKRRHADDTITCAERVNDQTSLAVSGSQPSATEHRNSVAELQPRGQSVSLPMLPPTEAAATQSTTQSAGPEAMLPINVPLLQQTYNTVRDTGGASYNSTMSLHLGAESDVASSHDFEYYTAKWKLPHEQVVQGFSWVLEEIELERVQLRRRVREARSTSDAAVNKACLEKFNELHRKLLQQLCTRGKIQR